MMRVWIVLAALSFAASASAENVLMKSNGLGAAAVGVIGVTAGAAALSDPPAWQGFPKGGDGPQFSNDAPRGTAGDCAAADGGALAKALKEDTAEPAKPADTPQGQISLSEASKHADSGGKIFDSNAIYGSGQSVTCAPQ
jgi:hypothetical protein